MAELFTYFVSYQREQPLHVSVQEWANKFFIDMDCRLKPDKRNLASNVEFVDLVHRAMFFNSLYNPKVREAVSEIPVKEINLSKVIEVAVQKDTNMTLHQEYESARDNNNRVQETVNKVYNKSISGHVVCDWCQVRGHKEAECRFKRDGYPKGHPSKTKYGASCKTSNSDIIL